MHCIGGWVGRSRRRGHRGTRMASDRHPQCNILSGAGQEGDAPRLRRQFRRCAVPMGCAPRPEPSYTPVRTPGRNDKSALHPVILSIPWRRGAPPIAPETEERQDAQDSCLGQPDVTHGADMECAALGGAFLPPPSVAVFGQATPHPKTRRRVSPAYRHIGDSRGVYPVGAPSIGPPGVRLPGRHRIPCVPRGGSPDAHRASAAGLYARL